MTKKYLFNKTENEKPCGGFDFYDFKKALADQYGARIAEFFSMAFREVGGDLLEQASKFNKLVDWLDKEIRQAGGIVNAFSPAAKMDDYTVEDANLWREQVHYVAELVYFRCLLLDNRTSNKERENIEYTVSKLYGVNYNEYLEDYV